MKKNSLVFTLVVIVWGLTTGLSPAGQERTEKPGARADLVPVAVRVFDGKQLVTGLALEDFEILEDGIPRPVEAFYFVDKNAVARREAGQDVQPDVNRRFYLLFQLFEYHPKLAEAIQLSLRQGTRRRRFPGDPDADEDLQAFAGGLRQQTPKTSWPRR